MASQSAAGNQGSRPEGEVARPVGRSVWEAFRQLMPVTRRWAYLDHAAVAPLPEPTRRTIRSWADQAALLGDTAWPRWAEAVEQVRGIAAHLLGAQPEEIALVPNTTTGISLVAEGFPWRPGENVVVPENEFPSNFYPWMNLQRRGVQLRRVAAAGGRLEVADLLAACDNQTRIIAVSWVGYATGWRVDLADLVEAAHRRGILVLADAIQALGVFPLDVRDLPVDFVAADGHKWMLGPEGAGILYIRREHLDRLQPLHVGWHSMRHPHRFDVLQWDLRPEAARLEGGSQNMVGLLGLGSSLRLLQQLGLRSRRSDLADRVLQIQELAAETLRRIGAEVQWWENPQHRSGILSFHWPGASPGTVKRRALEAGVVLSARAGRLRISPHAYNDEEDLRRLAEVVATCRER